jgi:glucose/arabinose dehydrogenase
MASRHELAFGTARAGGGGRAPAWWGRLARAVAGLLAVALLAAASGVRAGSAPLDRLRVPAGFKVELFSDAVPNARAMTLGRFEKGRGLLYVGSMSAGRVYAVELDGARAGQVHVIASGLDLPAGVAWRDGSLYVSAVSRILRYDDIDARVANPPRAVVVTDRLASETHHGAKFLAFGPDGKLYVPTGAPCNECVPDARHGILQRMNADGSGLETIASGIRNTVGFDWNPADRSLWFTDNGRDLLGDDLPADELDHITQPGEHFGYPYCHQGDLPDPQLGDAQHPCSAFVPPVLKLGAHVAALGMRFYAGRQFPEQYRGNVFIAEHGSWNRSRKVGYRVVRVALDAQGRVTKHEPFLEGFLEVDASGRETVHGRPADVLVLPDGSLLVSDDLAGAVYRVVWQGGNAR